MIRPTSKSDLKRECLYLCRLDIDKAEKMYDFLVKGMEEIPDVAPASKPFMQNLGEQANGLIGWVEQHQDFFGRVADAVQGVIARRRGAAPVPPSEPLPPINQ